MSDEAGALNETTELLRRFANAMMAQAWMMAARVHGPAALLLYDREELPSDEAIALFEKDFNAMMADKEACNPNPPALRRLRELITKKAIGAALAPEELAEMERLFSFWQV